VFITFVLTLWLTAFLISYLSWVRVCNLLFVFVVFFLAEDIVVFQKTSSCRTHLYVVRVYHFPWWHVSCLCICIGYLCDTDGCMHTYITWTFYSCGACSGSPPIIVIGIVGFSAFPAGVAVLKASTWLPLVLNGVRSKFSLVFYSFSY